MRVIRTKYLVVLLTTIALAPTTPASAFATEIFGSTSKWLGEDKYQPLYEVKVVVLRDGVLVKSTESCKGDGKEEAKYGLKFSDGQPVHVLFYLDKEHVPEMQSVSARDIDKHFVSTALMTVKMYKEMAKSNSKVVPLKEKLQCLKKMLPDESDAIRLVDLMLRDAEGGTSQ